MNDTSDAVKVVNLVQEASGRIVGSTRLQKIACLLELAGEGSGFHFSYHLFGPYSEELSNAIKTAEIFDLVHEERKAASWGGTYSVYTTDSSREAVSPIRKGIIETAINAEAIVLELAATAAYLAATKVENPWDEVSERKPEKATSSNMQKAKELYARLRTVAPKLPAI